MDHVLSGPPPTNKGGDGLPARWCAASPGEEVRPDGSIPKNESTDAERGPDFERGFRLLGQMPAFGGLRPHSSTAEEPRGDGAGVHFSVATLMGLLGHERAMAASTQEALEAKKASQMDKTFNRASRPMGRSWEATGGGKTNPKGGRGDGKKGKNKDGKGKDAEKKGG